jgi:hypothetical protein
MNVVLFHTTGEYFSSVIITATYGMLKGFLTRRIVMKAVKQLYPEYLHGIAGKVKF